MIAYSFIFFLFQGSPITMVYSGVLKLPWEAEDFLFFCCPECDEKSKKKEEFISHAYTHIFDHKSSANSEIKTDLNAEDEGVELKIEPYDDNKKDHNVDLDHLKEETDMSTFDLYSENVESDLDHLIPNEENDSDSEEYLPLKRSKRTTLQKLKRKSLVPKSVKAPKLRKGDLSCWQCSAVSFTGKSLKEHMLKEHGHTKCFKCVTCASYFVNKESHDSHRASQHSDAPPVVLCSFCPFTTNSNSNLTQHMVRRHAIQQRSICAYCPMTFSCNAQLNKHVQNVHTTKKYPCGECQELFESKKALRDHLIDAHNRQSFNCDKCEARYTSKSGLDGHILDVHEKKHLFKCTLCPLAYASSKNLKRHIGRRHQENKPYVCQICQRKFTWQSDMTDHIKKTHDKKKKKLPINPELIDK